MPNRILKESVCTSYSIDELSWFEEVLFYRLIVNCDDYGRFDGRTAVIKNRLFPLKENLTLKTVDGALKKLATVGLVVLYMFEDKPYLHLPTWTEHQIIRAKRSKYPSPDDGVETSEIICKQMNADESICLRNPIQSESESYSKTKEDARARRFAPPTVEEVRDYCKERKNGVDPERFVDFYASKGWKIGKEPMKDWRACVRTWESRDPKNSPKSAEAKSPQKDDLELLKKILSKGESDGSKA